MNIQPVSNGGKFNSLFSVACIALGFADLEGEPFIDYYCAQCAEKIQQAEGQA